MRIIARIKTMYPTIPEIVHEIDSGLDPEDVEGMLDDPVSMLPAEEMVDALMEHLGIEVSFETESEDDD